MDNDIIAPAGSHVLCPKGHKLCELSHDLTRRMTHWNPLFVRWAQPAPQPGQAEIKCSRCNSLAISMDKKNVILRPAKEVRRLPW